MRRIVIGMGLFLLSFRVLASVSNGFYTGIEGGVANQLVNFTPSAFTLNTNGSNLDNYALGMLLRLNLGYNFDKYNGLELGTTYDFAVSHNYPNGMGSISPSATTLDASYLLYLPTVIEKLSVFGRVGVSYDWVSCQVECNCNNDLVVSGSDFADVLGAGIKYNLSPQFSFRAEWIVNGLFFPIGLSSGSLTVGNWTNQSFQAGINYHF